MMPLPRALIPQSVDPAVAIGRSAYWDVVRGLGIILVVYGHVARGLMSAGILPVAAPWTTLDGLVYSFHMPLFFFISGRFFPATFARQGGTSLMKGKLATIAYPYLLWSVLQGGVETALAGLTNHGGKPALTGILLTPIDQFWFLYALFFVFAISTALFTVFSRGASVLLTVSALLFFIDFSMAAWQGVGYVAYYLLFFGLGAVTARTGVPPAWSAVHGWTVAVVCLGALVLLHQATFAPPAVLLWISRRMIALLCAVAGAGLTLCLASVVSGALARVVAGLGRRSMEVYLMHILAASGARIAASRVLGLSSPSLHLLIGVAAGLIVPVLLSRWIHGLGAGWLFRWPRSAAAGAR